MHLTPTCSMRILAHGIGIDKKNQVNNLKTFNILREGFSLRIDSSFIACEWVFEQILKSGKGINRPRTLFWSLLNVRNVIAKLVTPIYKLPPKKMPEKSQAGKNVVDKNRLQPVTTLPRFFLRFYGGRI